MADYRSFAHAQRRLRSFMLLVRAGIPIDLYAVIENMKVAAFNHFAPETIKTRLPRTSQELIGNESRRVRGNPKGNLTGR